MTLPETIEGKIKKWLKIKHTIASMEKIKAALKKPIEAYLSKRKDHTVEVAGARLMLVDVEMPYFNMEEAEKKLGKQALAPFWEKRTHKRINVS